MNKFDDPMFFMCGRIDEYIAGVDSYHHNEHEDQRWRFTCCSLPSYKTKSCRLTDYVNDLQHPIMFEADLGEVITGVFSYHHNSKE